MWPLPRDRASLLPLLPEEQRIVEETANADNPRDAQIHVNALFRVGVIHRRLGNMREAEGILAQSAAEFRALAVSNPANNDWAAAADIQRACLAVKDGRTDEGFAVIGQLMESAGTAPHFEAIPGLRSIVLEIWEALLEDRDEPERLYDVAGVALAYLDPLGSKPERQMYAMATKRRADAARKLGRQPEALETYEQAIIRLSAQDLESVGFELPRAMLAYAELLVEQDRTREAISFTWRAVRAMVKLTLRQSLQRRTISKRSTDPAQY